MKCQKIMVIAATAKLIETTLYEFAAQGAQFYLTTRKKEECERIANDLRVRGAKHVEIKVLDARKFDGHAETVQSAKEIMGGVDVLLMAQGFLPSQGEIENDFEATRDLFDVNLMSVISFVVHTLPIFREQGYGQFAVISSVAGDRGRGSNYLYGATKGALNTYLDGLRNRLCSENIHVLNIKPGLVLTPMTEHVKQADSIICADPAPVGRRIHKAILRQENTLYVPWFWLLIMTIVKLVPEFIFKKLRL